MKAQEFVVERLMGLFSKYEEVKIRYEYRINTQSHIVEIMPSSFFEGNKGYLADDVVIEKEFEALYPMENLVFISEGSLTEIRNADLELGYDKITFECIKHVVEYEVSGYSNEEEFFECNNYALAA